MFMYYINVPLMLKCGIKKKEGIKSSASAVISIGHSTIQGFRLFADKFNQIQVDLSP